MTPRRDPADLLLGLRVLPMPAHRGGIDEPRQDRRAIYAEVEEPETRRPFEQRCAAASEGVAPRGRQLARRVRERRQVQALG